MKPHIRTAAAAYLIIRHIKNKKRKMKRRWWLKEIFRNRNQYENILLKEMCFENTKDSIKNFLQINAEDFKFLLSRISPAIARKNTRMREAITASERLTITLRFLATGDSYTSLQYLFRVSKQSISVIIPEVCEAIIESLKKFVQLPSSEDEWLSVAKKFEDLWQFPHCIGAVGGQHLILQPPVNGSSNHQNHKQDISITLFALVDADYNFMYIDASCHRRISDRSICTNTKLYERLENKELNIPLPSVLMVPYSKEIPYMFITDEEFNLSEHTMKPFEGSHSVGSMERVFNYRLSRAHKVVENAFGVISTVFKVLRKPILLEPEKAAKIILATMYLHNFLRKSNNSRQLYTPEGAFDVEVNGDIVAGRWRNEAAPSLKPIVKILQRASINSEDVRLHLARHFMVNQCLPWQYYK